MRPLSSNESNQNSGHYDGGASVAAWLEEPDKPAEKAEKEELAVPAEPAEPAEPTKYSITFGVKAI
jgi:hypothetical protein